MMLAFLTFSAWQPKTDIHVCADSVDPDEMTHNKLSQINTVWHIVFYFTLKPLILGSGHIQIQRWKRPFKKLGGERVKKFS